MKLPLLEKVLVLALMSLPSSAAENHQMKFSRSGAPLRSILNSARRLEDGQQQGDSSQMEAFLADYSIRMTKCIPNQVLTDVDGNQHNGIVLFRMCPTSSCSDKNGCNSNYADFAVDMGTFVEAFVEDQKDNMNWDDQQVQMDNYGECQLYEGDGGGEDQSAYYMGPACTDDGTGIKLTVFDDEYCYEQSETSFESISNGWSLPYSDGGLVSASCLACTDDDGAPKEMCLNLYDSSPYRCEREWQFGHYYYDAVTLIYRYGQDVTGCTPIQVMQTPMSPISQAVWQDLIVSVFLVLCAAGGFAAYTIWWRKRK